MFASALCSLLWMDAIGKISGWTGIPEYEAQIPRLRWHAGLWSSLTILLPFLAAFLLGFAKKEEPKTADSTNLGSVLTVSESEASNERIAGIAMYLLRLGISVLGAVGFLIAFILIVSLLEKLGMRAH